MAVVAAVVMPVKPVVKAAVMAAMAVVTAACAAARPVCMAVVIAAMAVVVAVVAAVTVLLAIWPGARRFATDRVMSVVVQHRLRSAFSELCLVTWAGRTPAILWTAHHRDVLRVRLVLPAGIAASQFTSEVLEAMAAACDVPRIGIEPNARHTAVVVLVIVLRVPAAAPPVERPT